MPDTGRTLDGTEFLSQLNQAYSLDVFLDEGGRSRGTLLKKTMEQRSVYEANFKMRRNALSSKGDLGHFSIPLLSIFYAMVYNELAFPPGNPGFSDFSVAPQSP